MFCGKTGFQKKTSWVYSESWNVFCCGVWDRDDFLWPSFVVFSFTYSTIYCKLWSENMKKAPTLLMIVGFFHSKKIIKETRKLIRVAGISVIRKSAIFQEQWEPFSDDYWIPEGRKLFYFILLRTQVLWIITLIPQVHRQLRI